MKKFYSFKTLLTVMVLALASLWTASYAESETININDWVSVDPTNRGSDNSQNPLTMSIEGTNVVISNGNGGGTVKIYKPADTWALSLTTLNTSSVVIKPNGKAIESLEFTYQGKWYAAKSMSFTVGGEVVAGNTTVTDNMLVKFVPETPITDGSELMVAVTEFAFSTLPCNFYTITVNYVTGGSGETPAEPEIELFQMQSSNTNWTYDAETKTFNSTEFSGYEQLSGIYIGVEMKCNNLTEDVIFEFEDDYFTAGDGYLLSNNGTQKNVYFDFNNSVVLSLPAKSVTKALVVKLKKADGTYVEYNYTINVNIQKRKPYSDISLYKDEACSESLSYNDPTMVNTAYYAKMVVYTQGYQGENLDLNGVAKSFDVAVQGGEGFTALEVGAEGNFTINRTEVAEEEVVVFKITPKATGNLEFKVAVAQNGIQLDESSKYITVVAAVISSPEFVGWEGINLGNVTINEEQQFEFTVKATGSLSDKITIQPSEWNSTVLEFTPAEIAVDEMTEEGVKVTGKFTPTTVSEEWGSSLSFYVRSQDASELYCNVKYMATAPVVPTLTIDNADVTVDGEFEAGADVEAKFTVKAANLTNDITFEAADVTFSPATIAKDDAALAAGVEVTAAFKAAATKGENTMAITVKSEGAEPKTVTVKYTVRDESAPAVSSVVFDINAIGTPLNPNNYQAFEGYTKDGVVLSNESAQSSKDNFSWYNSAGLYYLNTYGDGEYRGKLGVKSESKAIASIEFTFRSTDHTADPASTVNGKFSANDYTLTWTPASPVAAEDLIVFTFARNSDIGNIKVTLSDAAVEPSEPKLIIKGEGYTEKDAEGEIAGMCEKEGVFTIDDTAVLKTLNFRAVGNTVTEAFVGQCFNTAAGVITINGKEAFDEETYEGLAFTEEEIAKINSAEGLDLVFTVVDETKVNGFDFTLTVVYGDGTGNSTYITLSTGEEISGPVVNVTGDYVVTYPGVGSQFIFETPVEVGKTATATIHIECEQQNLPDNSLFFMIENSYDPQGDFGFDFKPFMINGSAINAGTDVTVTLTGIQAMVGEQTKTIKLTDGGKVYWEASLMWTVEPATSFNITGKVVYVDNNPVEGAEALLVYGSVQESVLTTADGTYKFENVAIDATVETGTIYFSKAGYQAGSKSFTYEGGDVEIEDQILPAEVKTKSFTVSGVVVDTEGNPVETAEVIMKSDVKDDLRKTGAEGKFTFTVEVNIDVESVTGKIKVNKTGYIEVVKDFTSDGSTNVDLGNITITAETPATPVITIDNAEVTVDGTFYAGDKVEAKFTVKANDLTGDITFKAEDVTFTPEKIAKDNAKLAEGVEVTASFNAAATKGENTVTITIESEGAEPKTVTVKYTVSERTGVENVTVVSTVWSESGMLFIDAAAEVQATVYTLQGQVVETLNLIQGVNTVALPSATYVVKVGETAVKVSVR